MRRYENPMGVSRPLWRGLDYGPALVVLDSATPRELPPSWQPLAQRFQIAWCAVPAGQHTLHAIEDVIESLADRFVQTHVIARADIAEAAAHVVAEYPGAVRTVVLVGPGRLPEHLGVRLARVSGTDLGDPAVVRDVESVVERLARVSVGEQHHGLDQVTAV